MFACFCVCFLEPELDVDFQSGSVSVDSSLREPGSVPRGIESSQSSKADHHKTSGKAVQPLPDTGIVKPQTLLTDLDMFISRNY